MKLSCLVIRRLFEAVRNVAPPDGRSHGANLVVFKAQDGQSLFGIEFLDEFLKSGDDVFKGVIVIHMVGINVGNDGDIRMLLEEGAVAFIGFGNDVLPLP